MVAEVMGSSTLASGARTSLKVGEEKMLPREPVLPGSSFSSGLASASFQSAVVLSRVTVHFFSGVGPATAIDFGPSIFTKSLESQRSGFGSRLSRVSEVRETLLLVRGLT